MIKKLKYWLIRCLLYLYPDSKRMVTISILLPYLFKDKGERIEIDEFTLNKISKTLSLCNWNAEAIKFPMGLSREIIDEHIEHLIEAELNMSHTTPSIDNAIYNLLPEWLRPNDFTRFRNDWMVLSSLRTHTPHQ